MKQWLEKNKNLLFLIVPIILVILIVIYGIVSANTSNSTYHSLGNYTTESNADTSEKEAEASSESIETSEPEKTSESYNSSSEEKAEKTFFEDNLPDDETWCAVLENQGDIYFDSFTNDTDFELKNCFESNQAYKLDDLKNALIQLDYVDEENFDPSISYAFMDLGNDGVQELVISFDLEDNYQYCYNNYDITYILKKDNDKIQAVYAYTMLYERGECNLNCYGYGDDIYNINGSVHGDDYRYIDASGKSHFIYGVYYISGLNSCSDEFCTPDILEALDNYDIDPDEIVTYIYYFDEDIYPHQDVVKTFYVIDMNTYEFIDQSTTFNDSKYRAIFDDTGNTIIDETTCENVISSHENNLGITETIKNGAALKFTWIYQ